MTPDDFLTILLQSGGSSLGMETGMEMERGMERNGMDDSDQSARTGKNQGAHQSGSFLLRIWQEGREIEGETPKMRVFMRNLKTGEEHYMGDLDQLGEEVLRQFQQNGHPADGPTQKKQNQEKE
jgi:hypothetical protein